MPLSDSDFSNNEAIVLLTTKNIDGQFDSNKRKEDEKLHKKFSHPGYENMCSLLKSAGLLDTEFLKIVQDVSATCDTCMKFKRAEPS